MLKFDNTTRLSPLRNSMFSARLNTDFRGLAAFLIHKYCTHLIFTLI